MTKEYLDKLTYEILGAAIEVHKEIGPGLLESVYHACLKREFEIRKIKFLTQQVVKVVYKGVTLEADLRYDFLVENAIVVELKAAESMAPVYVSQLLTYMRLLQRPKGILVNFFTDNLFKGGQRTIVNELYRTLPDK